MSFIAQHAQLRQSIRHQVRQRRKQLTAQQQHDFALQAAERIVSHPKVRAAKPFRCFYPLTASLIPHR
jgi:5-formyltetrahydrofolate cyclo-ligase